MPFQYKHVLVVGATSGIGLALAEKMITNGHKIIAVGRRQENLDQLQKKHGKDKVSIFKFDITNLEGIPKFTDQITKNHPDMDCILLNSGIQRSIDFLHPESINLPTMTTELTTNYTSYIHLLKYLLPPLQSLSAGGTPTAVILVTSGLALTPLVRCGNYCSSKAALHHLILTMREQLATGDKSKGKGPVKIIEILPPAVQTELHDAKHQPDIKDGGQIGMPLAEFLDVTWKGLERGQDAIPVGNVNEAWEGFEGKRVQMFKKFKEMMEEDMKKHVAVKS